MIWLNQLVKLEPKQSFWFRPQSLPLGATCPFLTFDNHLAPIFVRALERDLDWSPISLTKLGRLFDWFTGKRKVTTINSLVSVKST